MVWVLKNDYVNDGSVNIFVFSTETDAFAQASAEIQNRIEESWDMYDYDQAVHAETINELIIQGKFQRAVQFWNRCHINIDGNYPEYWEVEEHDPNKSPDPRTIFPPSHFTALSSKDEDEEEEEGIQVSSDGLEDGDGFVTTSPGATCRGPHKEWNEYATADRRDGTYLCHQCRMFRQVFGGINKP